VTEPASLEGFTPDVTSPEELAQVIEQAFDYRGDVTVVLANGTECSGYIFNRRDDVPEPCLEMFETGRDESVSIRYADIRTVRFTGKDTAAGKSYAAWLERKAATRGA
jgi:hypothetical protein